MVINIHYNIKFRLEYEIFEGNFIRIPLKQFLTDLINSLFSHKSSASDSIQC